MARSSTRDGQRAGVLVIDKPLGLTSFDVVQRVRRLLRAEKAGHTGTLDPLATGVLAVCVGQAVKLQHLLAGEDKAYQAVVAFGASTETGDTEGRVLEESDPGSLTVSTLEAALPRFFGETDQVPPMYSAIRVGGRRLHEAARAGEEVERRPRRVRIDSLVIERFEPAVEGLARAHLSVRCGKGTYIRALAVDLGRAVGLPAHLAGLRRTAAGPFALAQAITLDEAERIGREDRDALLARLLSVEQALDFVPTLELSPGQVRDLSHGRRLDWPNPPRGLSKALDGSGRLVAICEPDGAGGGVRPVRVFVGSASPAPGPRIIR
jgi:tRNA pseudouridine55 synthase